MMSIQQQQPKILKQNNRKLSYSLIASIHFSLFLSHFVIVVSSFQFHSFHHENSIANTQKENEALMELAKLNYKIFFFTIFCIIYSRNFHPINFITHTLLLIMFLILFFVYPIHSHTFDTHTKLKTTRKL
jgi:L-asparagine transporter-like permease